MTTWIMTFVFVVVVSAIGILSTYLKPKDKPHDRTRDSHC